MILKVIEFNVNPEIRHKTFSMSQKEFSKRYKLACAPIVLINFSLTVKAATLIFISGCGSAISSAQEGKSGFIYNLVKS